MAQQAEAMMPWTPTAREPQGRNPQAPLPEEALLRAGPVRRNRLSVPGSGCLRRPIQSVSLRCFFRPGLQAQARGRKQGPEAQEVEQALAPIQARAAVMRLALPRGRALPGPQGPVLQRVRLRVLQWAATGAGAETGAGFSAGAGDAAGAADGTAACGAVTIGSACGAAAGGLTEAGPPAPLASSCFFLMSENFPIIHPLRTELPFPLSRLRSNRASLCKSPPWR